MSSANATREAPTAVAVAPFIKEIVGDVCRPRASLPPGRPVADMPGDNGPLAGIKNVLGFVGRGNAHWVDLRRKYGALYGTKFGPETVVCVSDPDLLARILRNEDRAWSVAVAWHTILEGLDESARTMDMPLTLDFEVHRDARKLLQPAFSAPSLARYIDAAVPMFENAIARWLRQGSVDFKREIRRLLANVSARIFLGIEDEREGELLDRALGDYWAGPLALVKNRWLSAKWRRATRGYRRLRDSLRARVAERRAAGGGEDLFSSLCAESRGLDWLDDDGLVRLFIGVMVGAFDTTSSGTASTAYLLAKNPEWQERLRVEAFSVGRNRISYEKLDRLEQMDRVWKETLRLYPVASHLPRRALRDVQLGSWTIPAGTYVLALIGSALQDPDWPTNPLQFDPDRFDERRAEDRKGKGLFMPFGAGAHVCPGKLLTHLEVKAFWHTLLTRCRIRLEPDYQAHHSYTPVGIVSGAVRLALDPL
jgi:cytochrome P450